MPINYDLKSTLEKEAILNSYKLFLKTCNFDIQILIQTKKQDLNSYISQIENQIKKEESNKIIQISKSHIDYIKIQNRSKNSSSKNFYILVNSKSELKDQIPDLKIIRENLNEKYFKIKESLSRCGNYIFEVDKRNEVEKIMYSFFNLRKSLKFI